MFRCRLDSFAVAKRERQRRGRHALESLGDAFERDFAARLVFGPHQTARLEALDDAFAD